MSENINGLLKKKEQIYNKMFELLDLIQFNETNNKLVINGGNIKHIGKIDIQHIGGSRTIKKLASLNRREGITLHEAMKNSFGRIQKANNST